MRHHPVEPVARRARSATGARNGGASVVADVAQLLATNGLHAALHFLNGRTRMRFTGVYRAAPPWLYTVQLFDRENPTVEAAGERTPLEATYCAITSSTAAPFSTRDAGHDPRLRAHAARDSVLCYYGVPLRLGSGRAWGTLCHFDLRPRLLATDELAVLSAVAPTIAAWLADGGYVPPA